MRTSLRRVLTPLVLAAFASAVAWAATYAVTSKAVVVAASRNPGETVLFQLTPECGQQLAGVNGAILYNPSYFGQPTVTADYGAPGFSALGREIEPGKFRFALYKSPTAAMGNAKPVLTFSLTPRTIPRNVSSTEVRYAFAAAAKPDGTSYLDSVKFSPITIQFPTEASDWSLFR